MNRLRLTVFVLFFATLAQSRLASVHADVITFSEPFDGRFSQAWTASPGALPHEPLSPFRPNIVSYAGGQSVSFETVDGVSSARLSVQRAPSWTRFGYLSLVSMPGVVGEVEARVNTLEQGESVIDGLFDLWLVNSSDHSRFVRVGMFGDRGDTLRSWTYSSSLSPYSTAGQGNLPPFAYQNNTWYRLRISQFPGRTLEVSIWNDEGDTRLVFHRFTHTLAELGSSFQIGFSQWMGGPNRRNSMLCAIDDIHGWFAR